MSNRGGLVSSLSSTGKAREDMRDSRSWAARRQFLALFFALASGAPKLLLPVEMLPMPLPGPFVKLIGVAEVLGALGLILPGLVHIRPGLTVLAAAGLVLVTICATVYNLAAGQVGSAVFAVVMGLLAAFVAYGRWRLAPLRGSSDPPAVQPASS